MRNLILYCLFNLLAVHLLHANKAQTQYSTKTIAAFEENKGQIKGFDGSEHPEVKYFYRKGNLKVFVLKQGISYQFEKNNYTRIVNTGLSHLKDSIDSLTNIETYRMDMEFIGANPNAEILTEGQSQDYTNYYNQDVLDVRSYKKIIYKNIYKGIDWVIYVTPKEELKYDFIIHPYADPSQIKLAYKNAEQILQDENGNLIIRNRMGDIVENKPISLQYGKAIETCFRQYDSFIQFKIQNYNHSEELIIDPRIVWATYYGGNSSTNQTNLVQIKLDKNNDIYSAGRTNATSNIAGSGHQINYGGANADLFLVKFNSTGSRQWASYYGGGGQESTGVGKILSIDGNNNVYLCGETFSSTNIAYNGFQNTFYNSAAVFLVKFNALGSRLWATYYGKDSAIVEPACITDHQNNVYLTGTSKSPNLAYNGYKNYRDSMDVFLVKFDSVGNRQWATYYGGTKVESNSVLGVDTDNNIYLAGVTFSSDSIALYGAQMSLNGINDGFIVKFNTTGSRLWGTYFGGNSGDGIQDIIIYNHSIYICGGTQSTSNLANNAHQSTIGGNGDGFLARLDSIGNKIWCTYYGGIMPEAYYNLALDIKEYVYLSGSTLSSNNISYRGIKDTYSTGSYDNLIVKFSKTGQRIWGTYMGGSGQDQMSRVTVDSAYNIYHSGSTQSLSGVTMNGFQTSMTGISGYILKLSCNRDTVLYDTICRGDTFVFNGIARTQSGVYLDTLETWDFCDSFITMNLTVSRRDTTHLYDSICYGGTKMWNGVQVSSTGVYLDTLMNSENCDSFLIYHLYIRALDSTAIYDTSCGNTPRVWNGMSLTTAGVYLDTLQNRYSCDSFLYYHYIPKMASSSAPIVSICKGSSYTVGMKSYASSGTYRDTLKNFQGCDSFITLSLTVRDTSFTSWTASICQGSYYLFQGDTLRTAGVYRDTLKNKNGCDSTLQVSLSVNSLGAKLIYDTICPDKSYAFAGKLLTASGIYRDSLKTKKGCDSIVTLNLFVRPKKPLSLIDSNYRLNATTGFTAYKWYRNSLPLSAPNLNYYFPSESGSFKVEVTEKNGCKYFSDSVQVVKAGLHSQHRTLNIEIFPNPAKDHLYIQSTMALDRELSIEIYTIDGRRLALPMQRISNLLYSISTASLSAGVYTIELKTAERTETRMFVVE